MQWRFASAHVDVVAVEGDVDGAELRRLAGALLDQSRQSLRERDAARLDADERDLVELRVRLDDLVGDAGKRPRQRFRVEQDLPRRFGGVRRHSTPFRPRWTGLKGSCGCNTSDPDGWT